MYNTRVGRRFDVEKLKTDKHKSAFAEILRKHHGRDDHTCSINDNWNAVKYAFLNASEEVLGVIPTQRKQWISNKTWLRIEARRCAKDCVNQARTTTAKNTANNNYKCLTKNVKRMARWNKRNSKCGWKSRGYPGLLFTTIRKLSRDNTRPRVPVITLIKLKAGWNSKVKIN